MTCHWKGNGTFWKDHELYFNRTNQQRLSAINEYIIDMFIRHVYYFIAHFIYIIFPVISKTA